MGKFGDFLLGALVLGGSAVYGIARGTDENGNFSLDTLQENMTSDMEYVISQMSDSNLENSYYDAEYGSQEKLLYRAEMRKRGLLN